MAKLRYNAGPELEMICRLLGLTMDRVLRRAGLAVTAIDGPERGLTGREVFALWEAVDAEAGRADLPVHLARTTGRLPIKSTTLAFVCSPDVETGLRRLALFKPLVGPVAIAFETGADGSLAVAFSAAETDLALPERFAAFELAYTIEMIRTLTTAHVVPLSARSPGETAPRAALDAHLGIATETGAARLVLSREDAARRLVSENAEVWAAFEPDLKRRLAQRRASGTVADRVRASLLDLLPAGRANADAVAKGLRLSRRSLQRQLRVEGESFRSVLDDTRRDLALTYIRHEDMRIEEISYLLGFRDPNSFYRAFQRWTGTTPRALRRDEVRSALS